MSNPYIQLLAAVAERVRASERIGQAPVVPVFIEEDEPDETRPAQGDSLSDRVESSLAKLGVTLIVFLDSVTATPEGGDELEIAIQVVERVEINRHSSGTQKACWAVLMAARAQLQDWAPEPEGLWSAFVFTGTKTVSSGAQLIRESRFTTRGFLCTE